METPLRILVRGSGDIASAVAHRLFEAGYAVVIHDVSQPTTTRRKMAFTDAIFEGCATLENVEARLVEKRSLLRGWLAAHDVIPVTTINLQVLFQTLHPQVLVDARMRKHSQPENQRRFAPLTIGLGPNFIAGQTVHIAIETAWGEKLGQVISHGATNPLEGEPKSIEGHTRDRYVYAPCAGIFHSPHKIGDTVTQGKIIAHLGETLLSAPIGGVLRGLTRSGVPVEIKTKVIEIDPRLDHSQISGIAERPARIAQGVLQTIQDW